MGGSLITGSDTLIKTTIVAKNIFSTIIGLNSDLLIGTGMDAYTEYSSFDSSSTSDLGDSYNFTIDTPEIDQTVQDIFDGWIDSMNSDEDTKENGYDWS